MVKISYQGGFRKTLAPPTYYSKRKFRETRFFSLRTLRLYMHGIRPVLTSLLTAICIIIFKDFTTLKYVYIYAYNFFVVLGYNYWTGS